MTGGEVVLARVDTSPDAVKYVVEHLPGDVRLLATQLMEDARTLAEVGTAVVGRYREFVARVSGLCPSECVQNGGDLENAIEEALGVDVVWKLLSTLSDMAEGGPGHHPEVLDRLTS